MIRIFVLLLAIAVVSCEDRESSGLETESSPSKEHSDSAVFEEYLLGGHYVEIGPVYALGGDVYSIFTREELLEYERIFVFSRDGTYVQTSQLNTTSGPAEIRGKWQYKDKAFKWQADYSASLVTEYPVYQMETDSFVLHITAMSAESLESETDAMNQEHLYYSDLELPDGMYYYFERRPRL